MQEINQLEKNRIPVFIGKSGSMKRIFEKELNCKIDVDSQTGKITLIDEDSLSAFILNNMVNAINIGQNPQNALKLENENYVHDIIDVKNFVKDHARVKVVMGRIIGKEGSTRKIIEEISKCNLALKDSLVSVVGTYENTIIVHQAIEMLIKGASHKSLYSYLERNKHNVDNELM
jgi:ribosomal RNA assembly protein